MRLQHFYCSNALHLISYVYYRSLTSCRIIRSCRANQASYILRCSTMYEKAAFCLLEHVFKEHSLVACVDRAINN